MIHAFNFTCDRDLDLSNLMVKTLYTHCDQVASLKVFNTDHNPGCSGYGNGSGWPASMLKLGAMRNFQPEDNDWVLSVDSDVVFGNGEVFKHLDLNYGIVGIKHRPEYYTHFKYWSHMSGALIFFRGDIAKKMCALSEDVLNNIRFKHFKGYRLTENEDVVLSYLASYVGANQYDIGGLGVTSNNFEQEVKSGELKSVYHLNYCPTMFLGEEVTGKWDIPKVLKMKGIEL